jgi:hypothetical protein
MKGVELKELVASIVETSNKIADFQLRCSKLGRKLQKVGLKLTRKRSVL